MTPKVSVIILCYKQEQYIERCCRSLFGQTLSDMEFIFVNDDPEGHCFDFITQVLLQYPQRQLQVRLLCNPEHLGISRSRQKALDQASGEYVTHCDADDWVDSDCYARMYAHAVAQHADVIGFDMFANRPGVAASQYVLCADHITQGFQCINGSLCNKLVARSLITEYDIRFPERINWGEDMCFSIQCRTLARHLVHVQEAYYHYESHKESFTKAVTADKYAEFVQSGAFIESFLRDKGLLDRYQLGLDELKFFCKEYYLISPKLRDIALWKSFYSECHASISQFPNIPRYLKLISLLIVKGYPRLASGLLLVRDWINKHFR